jgi:hypothetical protein
MPRYEDYQTPIKHFVFSQRLHGGSLGGGARVGVYYGADGPSPGDGDYYETDALADQAAERLAHKLGLHWYVL